MTMSTLEIIKRADKTVFECKSRDPFEIAEQLDVEVIPCNFKKQKGAYKVIQRNRFIFINQNLDIVTKRIVMLHELGHDALHRKKASDSGGFKEFNIFDMTNKRLEYEANIFAAQIELDDDEFLEHAEQGYDVQQIAGIMHSDINLVALKADIMIARGYRLRRQEHKNDFLKFNK